MDEGDGPDDGERGRVSQWEMHPLLTPRPYERTKHNILTRNRCKPFRLMVGP